MSRVVEFRAYRLKPGSRETFHWLVTTESAPLLRAWGTDVVHHGPCAQNPLGYVLIRAYADVGQPQESQDAFYASRPWKEGPREAILACIDQALPLVLKMDETTIDKLRTTPLSVCQ